MVKAASTHKAIDNFVHRYCVSSKRTYNRTKMVC